MKIRCYNANYFNIFNFLNHYRCYYSKVYLDFFINALKMIILGDWLLFKVQM